MIKSIDSGCHWSRKACCVWACLCSSLVTILVWLGVSIEAGFELTTLPGQVRNDCEDGLDPGNVLSVTYLPVCREGNKSAEELDRCGGSCFGSKIVKEVEGFYKQNGFQLVSFPSRAGPAGQAAVDLKAWWIPPAGGDGSRGSSLPPPRVIVQHGTNQNQQKFEDQLAGYLLASAGFGALLPSLRDHGYSGPSPHGLFSWGWDYPCDLLGAWDYARADPDGLLGGELPPGQVGLMGFSMGGFTAVNAFGVEPLVPAVWADSAVFNVKQILFYQLSLFFGSLGLMFLESSWAFAKCRAYRWGVQLDFHEPAKLLPSGPDTKRKVYVVQNLIDVTVPESHARSLMHLVSEYPDKYTLSGSWFTAGPPVLKANCRRSCAPRSLDHPIVLVSR